MRIAWGGACRAARGPAALCARVRPIGNAQNANRSSGAPADRLTGRAGGAHYPLPDA
jgi:hypothetical protein